MLTLPLSPSITCGHYHEFHHEGRAATFQYLNVVKTLTLIIWSRCPSLGNSGLALPMMPPVALLAHLEFAYFSFQTSASPSWIQWLLLEKWINPWTYSFKSLKKDANTRLGTWDTFIFSLILMFRIQYQFWTDIQLQSAVIQMTRFVAPAQLHPKGQCCNVALRWTVWPLTEMILV